MSRRAVIKATVVAGAPVLPLSVASNEATAQKPLRRPERVADPIGTSAGLEAETVRAVRQSLAQQTSNRDALNPQPRRKSAIA